MCVKIYNDIVLTFRLPLEQFLRMFTGIYKTSYYQEHINMQG